MLFIQEVNAFSLFLEGHLSYENESRRQTFVKNGLEVNGEIIDPAVKPVFTKSRVILPPLFIQPIHTKEEKKSTEKPCLKIIKLNDLDDLTINFRFFSYETKILGIFVQTAVSF